MFKLLQAVEHASNQNRHQMEGLRQTLSQNSSPVLLWWLTELESGCQRSCVGSILAWEDSTRRKATKPDLWVRKMPCEGVAAHSLLSLCSGPPSRSSGACMLPLLRPVLRNERSRRSEKAMRHSETAHFACDRSRHAATKTQCNQRNNDSHTNYLENKKQSRPFHTQRQPGDCLKGPDLKQ